MSHMRDASCAPFFKTLNNRFVYLSHDDDWYVRLYIKNELEFLNAAVKSILQQLGSAQKKRAFIGRLWSTAKRGNLYGCSKDGAQKSEDSLRSGIIRYWSDGVFVDLDSAEFNENGILIKMYVVGRFDDMDKMFDAVQRRKQAAPDEIIWIA